MKKEIAAFRAKRKGLLAGGPGRKVAPDKREKSKARRRVGQGLINEQLDTEETCHG